MNARHETESDEKKHRLDLTRFEIEVLRRAGEKYRRGLPIYLLSSKREPESLDTLLKVLETRLK